MRRFVFVTFLLLLLAGSLWAWFMYQRIWRNNLNLPHGEEATFYIHSGASYHDVLDSLSSQALINDSASFDWVARKKNYPKHVQPGRYILRAGMGSNALVNMLRSGEQEPVKVAFHHIRTPGQLAGAVSRQIEADSVDILALFNDRAVAERHGFSPATLMGVFIPNTYEFYWNTSAEEFLERMVREYRKFWNQDRLAEARRIGLEPMEVITLASIVDEETLFADEEARIAGVYMNRLKRGMRLQADPTVKFAAGDMDITRVLTRHLEIDSPYNTYRHGGLPPGPIVIPSISAIESVLNHERHDYLYFCAKDDFSGYHNFAVTLAQHNKNARSYRNALNRRKIYN